MNKNIRSKNPLEPKTLFIWIFTDIIPTKSLKRLTDETTFSHFLLIVDTYSKIPKLYGMVKITTEEVMDKWDMFQCIFGKLEKLG